MCCLINLHGNVQRHSKSTFPVAVHIAYTSPCFLPSSENVNLVNGSQRCRGKLEVRHNRQWGSICRDSNWGIREEILVCRELDCGKPSNNAAVTRNVERVAQNAYKTNCVGGESSIAACQLQLNSGTCEAVTVSCSGKP